MFWKISDWAFARAKEPSTWAGLAALCATASQAWPQFSGPLLTAAGMAGALAGGVAEKKEPK